MNVSSKIIYKLIKFLRKKNKKTLQNSKIKTKNNSLNINENFPFQPRYELEGIRSIDIFIISRKF